MGDLSGKKRTEPVRLVGANPSTGSEDNFAEVNSNNELTVVDCANHGGLHGSLTVGTTAVELKVGGTVLANRKFITMQATGSKVYWGYSNTVTTATGTRLYRNQTAIFPIGPGTSVFLIADTAGIIVKIGELS